MQTIIASEQDLTVHGQPFPEGVVMIHFKMVGIGPNTLKNANYMGKEICEIVRKQTGFFLIANGTDGLREAMHELVDRFCDSQGDNKNESKN